MIEQLDIKVLTAALENGKDEAAAVKWLREAGGDSLKSAHTDQLRARSEGYSAGGRKPHPNAGEATRPGRHPDDV